MSVDQFPLWGCGELLGSNARVFCCGVEHVTGYMVLCIALGPGSFCPKTLKNSNDAIFSWLAPTTNDLPACYCHKNCQCHR
jgi:hypothetical protein